MVFMLSVNAKAESSEDLDGSKSESTSLEEAVLDIFASNLSYDASVHIIFAVDAQLPEGVALSDVKMLFSATEGADLNVDNADYSVGVCSAFGSSLTVGGVLYDNAVIFRSNGISPEKYGDTVFSRAAVSDAEGNVFYSETVKFGVLDYVYSRYRDKDIGTGVTDEQMELYKALLEYGADAQLANEYREDRLVTSHGIRVETENGILEDGFSYGTFLLGDTVALTPHLSSYKAGFGSWNNSSGVASTERNFSFTVTESSVSDTYYASYLKASFDGLSVGAVPVGSENPLSDGGFSMSVDGVTELFGAEIVEYTDGNKVLKLCDNDSNYGDGVRIEVQGSGDYLVLGLDVYLEEFSTGTPLQLKLGGYMLQFGAIEDEALKIYDVGSATGYLDKYLRAGKWYNLRLVIADVSSEEGRRAYLFIDGECVAKSLNISESEISDSLLIYGLKSSTVNAYFDNIELYRTGIPEEIETAFAPERVFEVTQSASNDRFQNAEILLDEDALLALKEMDAQLFSEDIYLWIANLYDPETSALYFSISGRDAYGYLPDIETVSQGYGILSTLGLGGNTAVLNDEQKANLTAWIQTLQSNRDGYYYHPHWGVSIGNSRLSRDLGNSSSSYSASGSLAYRLFDDANYRLSGGSSGYKGTTTPSTYDNSLTSRLRRSAVVAVSKVLLTSENNNSSMPVHLRSEENLIRYLNEYWNSTCAVEGTHERHFCTDDCVIFEDPSDSYMKIEDGELVIFRGYRCTSCHVCSHTLGHSYSFGHHFTSMGAQVRSAGLGTPLVMYFRDIQENVQASLRDKAQAAYIEEYGKDAWDALCTEEQTAIRKAAENGIWEEEVTYGTISGLLKISGIPGAHGYEFLYAEAAIGSALKCALFTVENFVSTGQAIVSIYNPFNAMNGIMNNVNNYGTDKEVQTRARALIRSHAEELIVNTMGKLEGYLMPDGGYSYNYSGYCANSQGQPVAIEGSREGDVNGTALALGTRSALLSCLGVSVSAPFGSVDAEIEGGFDLNGDGDTEDEFDLNGDGVADAFETGCTHNMRFRYIITNKGEIEKLDHTAQKYVYSFDEGTLIPNGGEVIEEDGNKVFKVVDNSGDGGHSVTFNSNSIIDEDRNIRMTLDMKVISSNNTISHQIFVDSGVLRIDMNYKNGKFTFKNVTQTYNDLVDESGAALSINANQWFTIDVDVRPEGIEVNGETVYGYFTVKQGDAAQTAILTELAGYNKNAMAFRMYSLISAKNVVYYDNVSISNGVKPGVHDGEYHFDTVEQKIADENTLVKSPTFDHDTVYLLNSGSVDFAAYDYNTSAVIYNFDSVQANLLLSDANMGDRVDLILLDGEGRAITGAYLIVTDEGELSFFAPNGQLLTERIPREEIYAGGSSARVTKERDMVLSVDLSDWILVKLEYHHDMESPQLDIVIKYADNLKKGYKTTTAATLTGVDVLDIGADPYDFSTLNVNSVGRIYLDDLYIRNVFDGCSGEHEFIEKIASSNLKGIDSFGHKEYYLSCRNCGHKSTEIFVIHSYERIVKDSFKLSDASISSAAVYGESCSMCGEFSGKTFLYGLPLEDPTKYNFTDADGAESEIPNYLSIVTGKGKTATVMSETIDGVVNYYLRLAKKKGESSHSATFRYQRESGEALADKYVYEFDFRWIGASDMMNNRQVILVKMAAGGSSVCPNSYIADSTGTTVSYAGVNMHSGEWHAMKYLFVRNETNNGWNGTAFCDGKKLYTFNVSGNDVPYVDYETRWTLKENGVTKHSDLELDMDRLKVTAVAEKGHVFAETVTESNLISEANCLSPAVYGKICTLCGEISDTETFTVGEKGAHDFGNVIADKFKVCDADCDTAVTYYRSCKVCNETTDQLFTVGEPLGHSLTKYTVSEATKYAAEICYFECDSCDYATEPASYGDPLGCIFGADKALPATVSVEGFTSEPLTEGIWASVLSEQVGEVTNYYLNVQKKSNTSTHDLTFASTEAGGQSYVYEFDFRWHYSDRMRGSVPIIVKLKQGASERKSISLTAKADGSELYHNGVTFKSGEWHTVRYEFTKKADGTGWDCVLSIDGTRVLSEGFTGTEAVPKVVYETRYGQYQEVDTDGDGVNDSKEIKNCTDISFDIDNVYIKKD